MKLSSWIKNIRVKHLACNYGRLQFASKNDDDGADYYYYYAMQATYLILCVNVSRLSVPCNSFVLRF